MRISRLGQESAVVFISRKQLLCAVCHQGRSECCKENRLQVVTLGVSPEMKTVRCNHVEKQNRGHQQECCHSEPNNDETGEMKMLANALGTLTWKSTRSSSRSDSEGPWVVLKWNLFGTSVRQSGGDSFRIRRDSGANCFLSAKLN